MNGINFCFSPTNYYTTQLLRSILVFRSRAVGSGERGLIAPPNFDRSNQGEGQITALLVLAPRSSGFSHLPTSLRSINLDDSCINMASGVVFLHRSKAWQPTKGVLIEVRFNLI